MKNRNKENTSKYIKRDFRTSVNLIDSFKNKAGRKITEIGKDLLAESLETVARTEIKKANFGNTNYDLEKKLETRLLKNSKMNKKREIFQEKKRVTEVDSDDSVELEEQKSDFDFGQEAGNYTKNCYLSDREIGMEKINKRFLDLIKKNERNIDSNFLENIITLYFSYHRMTGTNKNLVRSAFGYLISKEISDPKNLEMGKKIFQSIKNQAVTRVLPEEKNKIRNFTENFKKTTFGENSLEQSSEKKPTYKNTVRNLEKF